MRKYLIVSLAIIVAACAKFSASSPPSAETTEVVATTETPPCEAAIDAIGFDCADGHSFSARHDVDDACVVVFEGRHRYVLPRGAHGRSYSNGTITLTQAGETASLTGSETGPHENCTVAAMDH